MGRCQTLLGSLAVFIILYFCGVYQSQMVSCEIFTSVVGLKKTLQAEQQVAELLQAYIIQEEIRLAQLKRFVRTVIRIL